MPSLRSGGEAPARGHVPTLDDLVSWRACAARRHRVVCPNSRLSLRARIARMGFVMVASCFSSAFLGIDVAKASFDVSCNGNGNGNGNGGGRSRAARRRQRAQGHRPVRPSAPRRGVAPAADRPGGHRRLRTPAPARAARRQPAGRASQPAARPALRPVAWHPGQDRSDRRPRHRRVRLSQRRSPFPDAADQRKCPDASGTDHPPPATRRADRRQQKPARARHAAGVAPRRSTAPSSTSAPRSARSRSSSRTGSTTTRTWRRARRSC